MFHSRCLFQSGDNMKKYIIFLFTVLLLISLTACGGKDNQKENDNNSVTTSSIAETISVNETSMNNSENADNTEQSIMSAENSDSTTNPITEGQVLPDMPID